MNWDVKLNKAIDYIEENLNGTISNVELSKIMNCSIYNFQRMFSYIADKPLSEYIRSRRLTLAAFDILNTQDRLLDIAVKYGYESQDSFTRAFKAFHGVLPSKVRNEVIQLRSCPKLSFQLTVKGETHMNYQIEQWPAFSLAGFKHHIKTEQAFDMIPQIWDNAWKNGTMDSLIDLFQKTDYRPAGFVGMVIGGNLDNAEDIEYFIGVTNHVAVDNCNYVPAPEIMAEVNIKSTTWAVFEANGKLPDAMQSVYKRIYSEWLPNSGYDLEDFYPIECYMQDERQEIWLAIKKRK